MSRASLFWLLTAAACSFPAYTEAEPVPVDSCHGSLVSRGELEVECDPACNPSCDMTQNVSQECTSGSQCQSGVCEAGVCALPSVASCSNGKRDGTETDVDCGGTDGCEPCATGERCESDYDCNLARCNAGFCQKQSCGDGLLNQDESDVDCGGSSGCSRCTTKQHCTTTSDCLDAQCLQGLCQPQSCDDGVLNGDETDMDCGGSCAPCSDLKGCASHDDCLSSSCDPSSKVCLEATCDDGILNGGETALDCGASCGDDDRCELLQDCSVAADCKSGRCEGGRCMPAAATGAPLPTTGWVATASDIYNQSYPAKAIDGNANTYWESGRWQYAGMWFRVDMLEPRPFFAVELLVDTNGDWPRHIRLLLSEDGETFTPASNTLEGTKYMRFDFASGRVARYIKLEITGESGNLWWRIDELRVLQ